MVVRQTAAVLRSAARPSPRKAWPEAFLLYTNDTSEPGRALPRSITGEGKKDGWQWMQVVVNQDMPTWEKILADASKYPWIKPYDFQDVVDKDMHLRGLQTFAENWDKWEVAHATPPDDPKNYQDVDGVMLSYTYNRLYTVSSPRPLDAYRTKSGLAIMRHYSLNENEMSVGNDDILGYFVCDVERAGPYSMMAEARAVAYGDPFYLGSLTGNTNNRGFPRYVRRFHAAFLALPALPSRVLPKAASDPEVVVRAITTPDTEPTSRSSTSASSRNRTWPLRCPDRARSTTPSPAIRCLPPGAN